MDNSIYIPKWLIAAFLAAVGCVAGWMLGAADLVTATIGSPGPSTDSSPPAAEVAAPQAAHSTGSADQAQPAAAESSGSADQAQPAAANAAPPAPDLALQGAASTTNSTVRITSTADDHRGEAMTPNSAVRIVSTPDGNRGEAATPNSNVRINAVVSGPNDAGSPASTTAGAAPASTTAGPAPAATTAGPAPVGTTAGPAPASTRAEPATSAVVVAPPGARTAAAPAPFSATAPPQIATPLSSSVTGLGDWGPPQPLPPLVSPPFFAENIWNPLPGATSRGIAFSEWESYRTDVAGRNILVTTDDSNFFRDRNGKLNANTGDIDASGLNVIGANDSVIRGSESADEAPWQTMAAALVDLAGGNGVTPPPGNGNGNGDDDGDDDEDTDEFTEVDEPNGDVAPGTPAQPGSQPSQGSPPTSPAPGAGAPPPPSNGDDGFDFPYESWVEHASRDHATAVHTDEGTTLSSGSDAIVIGADGFDDDDNRAVGENIAITRDDGNVVIGGTGDVNAQIGDAEQGVLVMDVNRTFIQGGGAY
jgi:hypothetical protein